MGKKHVKKRIIKRKPLSKQKPSVVKQKLLQELNKLKQLVGNDYTLGKVRPIAMKKPMLTHNLKIQNTVLKYDKTAQNVSVADILKDTIENKFVKYEDGIIGIQVSNQARSGITRIIQFIVRLGYLANSEQDLQTNYKKIENLLHNNIKKTFNVLKKAKGVYVFAEISEFMDYFVFPLMFFIYENKSEIYTGRIPIFSNSLESFCRHIYANKFFAADTPSLRFDREDLAILIYGNEDALSVYSSDKQMTQAILDVRRDFACFNVLEKGLINLLTLKDTLKITDKYWDLETKKQAYLNFYKKESSLKKLKKGGLIRKSAPAQKKAAVKAKLESKIEKMAEKEIKQLEQKQEKIQQEAKKTTPVIKKAKVKTEELTNKVKTASTKNKTKQIKKKIEKAEEKIQQLGDNLPTANVEKEEIKQELQQVIEDIKDVKQEVSTPEEKKIIEETKVAVEKTIEQVENVPEVTKTEEKIIEKVEAVVTQKEKTEPIVEQKTAPASSDDMFKQLMEQLSAISKAMDELEK